ncbi:hypothetical protein Q757_02890, partial [Oenococcus alcoholitolerans]
PEWDQLPNFDIYLDQLLDITNQYIYPITGEKITKTMMHNYTKAEVIMRPDNKKYGRIHLAGAIIVSLLKSVFSLEMIKSGFKLELDHGPSQQVYDFFIKTFNDLYEQKDFTNMQEILSKSRPNAELVQIEASLAVIFRFRAISTVKKITK